MQKSTEPRMGIPSIVYDLRSWDYRVDDSGFESLKITVTKNDLEMAVVSFSSESLSISRSRAFTALEEHEFQLFLDDLLWEDEFLPFAHHSFIQVEYQNAQELVRMIEEKYSDDLLYVQFNDEDQFMGYLEEVSVKKIDGSDSLVCYFNPVDDSSELIRCSVILQAQIKAIATASSVKVEGAGETLEITRHIEHSH